MKLYFEAIVKTIWFLIQTAEAYSEPSQISKIEIFC